MDMMSTGGIVLAPVRRVVICGAHCGEGHQVLPTCGAGPGYHRGTHSAELRDLGPTLAGLPHRVRLRRVHGADGV